MLSEVTQGLALALSPLAAAPGTAPPATASAERPEPIVVTASRTADDPPGLTIVDAAEIERLQPASLLEVLNDVAGVRAFSTGGAGGGSFLSIRGGEPNFTLVLLDGIKVNNPTNSRGGAFDLAQIDPNLVAAVEVARGAGSAIHGSDALSGVVHIRLREPVPGETRLTARAEAGTQGDASAGLGLRTGWDAGGALLAGSWFDSDGLDLGSSLERRQALARIGQRIGGFEARLIGLYADIDRSTFPEDSGGPLLAVNRARETGSARLWATALSVRRARSAAFRPNLSIAYAEQEDETDTPAIAPGALDGVPALTARNLFSRLEAIADLTFERGPASATVGGALLHESGRSDGTIDFGFPLPVRFDLDRTTRSLFAEATLRPVPAFTIDLAGRVDDGAGRASAWTGSAALTFRPRPALPAFYLRIGEGYKLPSFFALGHPLIGNPALRPERSRNLEAGLEWARGAEAHVRLTLFANRFRDLIDFDPLLFTTVNRDRVHARGAELEGRWTVLPALALAGALTWLDLDSPTPLRGRPRWQGSVRAVWRAAEGLELNAAVRANSSFNDSSIPTGLVVTGGHAEADLGLRYRLSPRLVLGAALRNLTDSRHQDAVGFPAPGRLVRATVSAELF